ncbi:MAG: hypothetical protein Kilf2KO_10920 [Rhodospirillales bacterium]
MLETTALVLAAGLSRRMGGVNKLLIPLGSQPMIRICAAAYLELCDGPVTLVTGHQAGEVRAALDGLPLSFVHNPDYASGQASSVAVGLRAAPEARATFVALGDQPRLTAEALRGLLAAHLGSDETRITLPWRGQARGNPLIVPQALMALLLADEQNPGCRKFTRDNPDRVNPVATDNPAFFADVDSPQDLLTLEADLEGSR